MKFFVSNMQIFCPKILKNAQNDEFMGGLHNFAAQYFAKRFVYFYEKKHKKNEK